MENRKYVYNSRSTHNGIIFFSDGGSSLAIKATIDDEGNITSSTYFDFVDELEAFAHDFHNHVSDNGAKHENFQKAYFISCFLIPFILGLVLRNLYWTLTLFFFMLNVLPTLYSVMKLTLPTLKKGSKKYKVAKFHSAQHMIVNAYEDLQRVPTLKELKEYSRLSMRCGARPLLNRFFFNTLLLLCLIFGVHTDILTYMLALVFCWVFSSLDRKFGFTIAFESLFLRKPSDRELNVAIEGIKQYDLMQEVFSNEDADISEEQIEKIIEASNAAMFTLVQKRYPNAKNINDIMDEVLAKIQELQAEAENLEDENTEESSTDEQPK